MTGAAVGATAGSLAAARRGMRFGNASVGITFISRPAGCSEQTCKDVRASAAKASCRLPRCSPSPASSSVRRLGCRRASRSGVPVPDPGRRRGLRPAIAPRRQAERETQGGSKKAPVRPNRRLPGAGNAGGALRAANGSRIAATERASHTGNRSAVSSNSPAFCPRALDSGVKPWHWLTQCVVSVGRCLSPGRRQRGSRGRSPSSGAHGKLSRAPKIGPWTHGTTHEVPAQAPTGGAPEA